MKSKRTDVPLSVERTAIAKHMREQARHTPGEWVVGIDPGDERLKVMTDNGQAAICTVNVILHAAKANARLIAAAPQLLEALEAAEIAVAYYHEHEGASGLRSEVKAAITKATKP